MKVKDFLDTTGCGITSVGIYTEDDKDLAVEADIYNICNFADLEVSRIDYFIYDETERTIDGTEFQAKKIRAIIYVKRQ